MSARGSLPASQRARPMVALIVARVVYAVNWYNVGAVLPLIGVGLGAGPEALGIVLGAFLVGVGIFQIPAGIAAVRWGPRNISLAGLAVLGAAGVISGWAPTWQVLALIRFVAGVGAACFFSPALSLIASYYPEGRRGPVIGLYNGGFSIGAAIGLFGGAIIGERWGWHVALSAGGAALLGTVLMCAIVLPPESAALVSRSAAEVWNTVGQVLRSRSLWALSLGLTGFWGAIYVVAQYFVDFGGVVHPEWGLGLTAALATVVVIVSFPGGPLGGWLGERVADRRGLLALFGAAAGVLTLLIPFLPLAALVGDFVALGLLDGMIFAILYLVPTYLPESRGAGLALGVAVVNSIQVSLGSGLAIAFGFIVATEGYTAAWIFGGGVAILLLPLLVWVTPKPVERDRPADGG
ncbi:MAG: MFS transporter [Thermoplasmata archaeon]|nr:MFS transporter [Thermoplasmata archaeon]